MTLEFLPDGLSDRPLIRLYGFDRTGAMRLREAFRTLSTGSRQSIPLHEEWWIEPVEECTLDLRVGTRDLGVVERAPSKFECVLTAGTWTDMISLVNPFCESEGTNSYQWLNKDGEILLLLSPNGQW
jgi:hypothetical protein